ncbi:YidC/Oxa1 family membrane protein insertase [Streptococcus sp. DD12]|uniref:YidC/Oxa1 family membrane protein insertase n=1 Tax=Streptococcus sp. DD12 TaxID=1777880 RepID=UPI0007912553|nr:YidC/Oxa1 family membrane protein insertase [Streptococcus sp. DD12]KXT75555.1 Inner membrane protein translocase component YidC [Streptococcus sp. DD12]
MKKTLRLIPLLGAALLVLSACGTSAVTNQSTGAWETIVYYFALAIKGMSFGQSMGLGIVLFTLAIRVVMIPLYHYQMTSSRKMQEIQPQLKAIQEKYRGLSDTESRLAMTEETRAVQKEAGVSTWSSLLPLLVQMPILWALYQALTRVDFVREGHFLWLDLAKPDQFYFLPILAALFTFLSSWLTNKAIKEKNGAMTAMTYGLPVMIFFFAFNIASGVSLYWTVSNAFQVGQILLLNNPFKIIAEREEKEAIEKEREAKKRRAMRKGKKKRK